MNENTTNLTENTTNLTKNTTNLTKFLFYLETYNKLARIQEKYNKPVLIQEKGNNSENQTQFNKLYK